MSVSINLIEYHKTGDMIKRMERIIESAQKYAFRAVNIIFTLRNRRIAEELQGADCAEYSATVIRNLYEYLRFYRASPDFVHLAGAQSFHPSGEEKGGTD